MCECFSNLIDLQPTIGMTQVDWTTHKKNREQFFLTIFVDWNSLDVYLTTTIVKIEKY